MYFGRDGDVPGILLTGGTKKRQQTDIEELGEATDMPAKSLIRMFGPRGNPQARNLFGIIGFLQKEAGIEYHVTPQPR